MCYHCWNFGRHFQRYSYVIAGMPITTVVTVRNRTCWALRWFGQNKRGWAVCLYLILATLLWCRILLHTSLVLRRNMTKDQVDYRDHLSYLSLQGAHYTTTLTHNILCWDNTVTDLYRAVAAVSYDIHSCTSTRAASQACSSQWVYSILVVWGFYFKQPIITIWEIK